MFQFACKYIKSKELVVVAALAFKSIAKECSEVLVQYIDDVCAQYEGAVAANVSARYLIDIVDGVSNVLRRIPADRLGPYLQVR